MAKPSVARGPVPRIVALDALRGVAIVAMIVYHFCFDLRHFGVVRWDFEHDIRWLSARTAILSSFLLIAGISAVCARRVAASDARWLRHVLTIGSRIVFPGSFIWFGVLHAIAVSLLLARPLIDRPRAAIAIGVAIIVAGLALSSPRFDNRVLGWLGFMTGKPVTEDYVPLFPWSGVLLLGIAVGHWLTDRGFAPLTPLARLPRMLQLLGRHSLVVYLVHQPVLFGVLMLLVR
jgi:uncharacterized membrane protein